MFNCINGYLFYHLLDSGWANVLGVETLRHGTDPVGYMNIRIKGGSPYYGGKYRGSNPHGFGENTEGFFYVFKDSAYSPNYVQIISDFTKEFFSSKRSFFSTIGESLIIFPFT